jgi:translation initiation factor 3 subunit I
MKTYGTDRPVNSASISSLRDHVMLGGGQEAMQVTTTSTRAGKFEVRIFHKVFEEEIGRVKGHFGPINTVRFHPDGKGCVGALAARANDAGRGSLTVVAGARFASGGEDGYVRLHHFDPDYFTFEMDM